MYALLKDIGSYDKIISSYAFGEYAHVSFNDTVVDEDALKSFLKEKGFSNIELKRINATIEDCFIHLLKK